MSTVREIYPVQLGMHWDASAGGADRYFAGLLSGLRAIGLEHSAGAFGRLSVDAAGSGYVSLGAADAPLWQRWQRVRKFVGEVTGGRRPEVRGQRLKGGRVLAAHFALYAWPALSLLRGRRWVFHFHGPWSIESSAEGQSGIAARAKFLLERSVYRRASRFVVLSQASATLLSERFDVPQEKIAVVPGGVDLERFRPLATRQELRRMLGWESDKRIVLAVRRLAKRMGLENLIAAFAEVAGQFPDMVLYIAGKGAERGALERAVEERGLGARVKFLGFVADEDLPAVYAAADVTVVPSQELEGFGLVTLESLACGTPCLVTPVGGLPEAVAGFDKGLVTKGSRACDLASGLASWLREGAPSAGECRAYAEQFGWPRIARRVMEVYAAASRPL